MKLARLFYRIIRMAQNPQDYTRVEKFRETLRRYRYFDGGVAKVNSIPEIQPLMRTKPLMNWEKIGFADFKNYPEDTLGYQFTKFLEKNELSVLDYARDEELSDEEFYIRRVVQTHDMWHVVLDYPADDLGEMAVNSFMIAQIGWPPAGFYIGGYALRQMVNAPQTIGDVIAAVSDGWTRGRKAKQLFAVEWETQMRRPLAEIRRELLVN